MSSVEKNQVLNLLRQTGSYLCPHFQLSRVIGQKKGCCGQSHNFDYIPACKLIDGSCHGLAQCPRLDIKLKSTLIQQWTHDLQIRKVINVTSFMTDV